jgi:transglutaminase-like putative cysteine protease
MIYRVTHTTHYEYTDAVSLSHHLLRLTPRELPHQRCLWHEVEIQPAPAVKESHFDYFENCVDFITIEGPHQRLVFTSRSNVSVSRPAIPTPSETLAWNGVRDFCRGEQIGPGLEASEYIFDSPLIHSLDSYADYAKPFFPKDRPILEAVLDLTRQIHKDFKFDPKATTLATPLEEVFKNRKGVCQDFAHLEIACLRSFGLPARYVSGYLETDPPPGQPRLAGADASHAWISFYCHGMGWIDIDPTNNVIPTTRHISVAVGRDYNDVSPVRGVILGGGEHALKFAVDVLRVDGPEKVADSVNAPTAGKE